jgi:putative transposase
MKHLAKLKHLPKYEFWKLVGSQAIQDIPARIDCAYNLFFKNLKRNVRTAPPSFRKVSKYKSFTLKQCGWKYNGNNKLIINKVCYRFFKSRDIEGKIKTITIKRDSLNDIYIYFVCDVQENEVLARTGKIVGLDFGLKKFLTASDKNSIESPLFFKRNEQAIKKASQSLSRKKRGSHNRSKAKMRLARIHKKAQNQRKDFHWKLAQQLCGEYSIICIEDLNIKGMQKRWGKKISDLGFASFVNILEYESTKTGSTIVKVGRFYPSSQICHDCGYQNHETKDLNVREWDCPHCGSHHDRDVNAAINIRNEGERVLKVS